MKSSPLTVKKSFNKDFNWVPRYCCFYTCHSVSIFFNVNLTLSTLARSQFWDTGYSLLFLMVYPFFWYKNITFHSIFLQQKTTQPVSNEKDCRLNPGSYFIFRHLFPHGGLFDPSSPDSPLIHLEIDWTNSMLLLASATPDVFFFQNRRSPGYLSGQI